MSMLLRRFGPTLARSVVSLEWIRGTVGGVFRGATRVVHWYHSECRHPALMHVKILPCLPTHQLRAPLIESVALRACAVVAMSALDEYESEYRSHIQAAEEKLEHAEQAIPQSDSRRAAISNEASSGRPRMWCSSWA